MKKLKKIRAAKSNKTLNCCTNVHHADFNPAINQITHIKLSTVRDPNQPVMKEKWFPRTTETLIYLYFLSISAQKQQAAGRKAKKSKSNPC